MSTEGTQDEDNTEAFEIWRLYISQSEPGNGLGGNLIFFAEQEAVKNSYREIIIGIG